MDAALIIEWIIKSIVLILICLTGFAYLTLYERKALARIQVRIGPNRAGPFGVLQPIADGVKLIFKEELIPAKADRVIFILAPIVTVVPALIILAVLPFGNQAVKVEVTGLELKNMLENGVSRMPTADGRFPQVSGLCFTYNIAFLCVAHLGPSVGI